jgi:hypothetical protein
MRDIRALRIGGVSKADLLRRLGQASVQLNDYARALFAAPGFRTSSEARDVRLAVVSLPELGLPNGGRFHDIVCEAKKAGLACCPLELAPHLRLSTLDQPAGPYLTVASPTLGQYPSTPNGFYVRRLADGLWLRGYRAADEHVYAPEFSDFAFLCT